MTATAAAPRAATPTPYTPDPNAPPPAGMNNPAAERLFEKINNGNPRHRAMPADLQGKLDLADALLEADLVPYKDGKTKLTRAQVAIILQLGDELGLAPLQAVQGCAIVHGRPGPMYQTALAVVQASGKLESYEEIDGDLDEEGRPIFVNVTVKRVGAAKPVTMRFSWKDAIRAGLLKNPTWTKYPRDMLRNRAGGRALKIGFADVLAGIALADELEDALASRQEATDAAFVVPASEMQEVRAAVARAAAAKTLDGDGLADLYRRAVGAEIPRDSAGVTDWTAIGRLGRAGWTAFATAVRAAASALPARVGRAGAPAPTAAPRQEAPTPRPSAAPAPAKSIADRAREIGARYRLDEAALLATVRSSTPHTALEQLTDGDLEMLDEVLGARDAASDGN